MRKKSGKNIFLTSDVGGVQKKEESLIPIPFSDKNEFFSNLLLSLNDKKKFVLIASDPFAYEKNDSFLELDKKAFAMSGLEFDEYAILDYRSIDIIDDILKNASLVLLAGGNTYEQNAFFHEINLSSKLEKISCSILGISAGAMNAGSLVINSSLKSKDSSLPLVLNGLSFSPFVIEPHFQKKIKNLEEMKLILQASETMKIYGLRDGSYILNDILYGRCDLIYNGQITKICEDGSFIRLSS